MFRSLRHPFGLVPPSSAAEYSRPASFGTSTGPRDTARNARGDSAGGTSAAFGDDPRDDTATPALGPRT